MKSLLWTLIHVVAAVILAFKILRDFRKTVNDRVSEEEKEAPVMDKITGATNDEHGER